MRANMRRSFGLRIRAFQICTLRLMSLIRLIRPVINTNTDADIKFKRLAVPVARAALNDCDAELAAR